METPVIDNTENKQIKLIPPGCQTIFKHIISSNDVYFCYASTMTINVFLIKNNQIKCILNPAIEKFIKCLSLNQGKSKELAVFYENEILIFDVEEEKIIESVICNNPIYIEFNQDNKLLIISKDQILYFYDKNKQKLETIKTSDKVSIAKWNPFDSQEIAYTTNKGVSFHNIKNKNRISGIDLEIKDDNYICELSWYTLDENYKYVLVGLFDGHTYLIDLAQNFIIMKFEKFGQEISSLVWLKHEPGTFLSFSKNSGRVAFWNVSKKNYNEIAKFSDGPIMNCIALSDPNNVLFTLENGSIVVFDVKNRKKVFTLEPNHSETIFDLKYNHLSYGIFATCSYESAIKIWDLNENKIIWDIDVDYILNKSSMKKEEKSCTHVYSLKWSPTEKELLVSGDSKSFVRIWNIDSKKLVVSCKVSNFPDAHTIGVDWDKSNNIICTCGDSVVLLTYDKFSFKLSVSKSIKLVSSCFQIKFDPFVNGRYAVACLDGKIRIFNVNSDKNIDCLVGHKSKVFGIAFHPNVKNLLATSSDDFSIGVWNLQNDSTTTENFDSKNRNGNYKSFFLNGHEKNTRHLIWLKDRSNILISGSWDGTIKIWNTDMRALISNISEHYSDVYGLDISPHHPYLLTSCSRDNSIRFFNILSVSLSASDIILSFDDLDFSQFKSYFSKLEEKLKDVEKNLDIVSAADIISRYFFYYEGLNDYWDIIKVITKRKEYCDQNNKIFYVTDLYSAYRSKAQNLEFKYYSKTKTDYSIRKEDLLKEAIDICAKIGDWEKFCELSIENNQWEKAIMAAPNVSISYWKELTQKYSDFCSSKNSNERKFANLLSNQLQPAQKDFIESGDYEDAKIVWLTRGFQTVPDKENCINRGEIYVQSEETLNKIDNKLNTLSLDDGLFRTSYFCAKQNLLKGNPIIAAASYIAIKDVFNTLKCLIRTGLIEIAYMTMRIFNEFYYEEDIMFALLLKDIRKNNFHNFKNIIEKTQRIDVKIVLCLYYTNYNKNNTFSDVGLDKDELIKYTVQTGNDFLNNMLNSQWTECYKLFYIVIDNLSSFLINKVEIDINLIYTLMNYLFYFKGMDISLEIGKNENFVGSLIISAAFLEALNNNYVSCINYLKEYNRLLVFKKFNVRSNERNLLLFIVSFISNGVNYKNELNKLAEICKEIKFYEAKVKFTDYLKLIQSFKKCDNKSIIKYTCDDIESFICLPEEIFPVNITKISTSHFNNKRIKGNPIRIGNFNLSASQAMEWFKFLNFETMTNEYKFFNSY